LIGEHRAFEQTAFGLQFCSRRDGQVDSLLVGLENGRFAGRFDLIDNVLGANTGFDDLCGIDDGRIDLQPGIDLRFFTIGTGV